MENEIIEDEIIEDEIIEDEIIEDIDINSDIENINELIKNGVQAQFNLFKKQMEEELELVKNAKRDLDTEHLNFKIKNEMKKLDLDYRLFDFIKSNDLDSSIEKMTALKSIMDEVIESKTNEGILQRVKLNSYTPPNGETPHVKATNRPSYMR